MLSAIINVSYHVYSSSFALRSKLFLALRSHRPVRCNCELLLRLRKSRRWNVVQSHWVIQKQLCSGNFEKDVPQRAAGSTASKASNISDKRASSAPFHPDFSPCLFGFSFFSLKTDWLTLQKTARVCVCAGVWVLSCIHLESGRQQTRCHLSWWERDGKIRC